MAVVTLLGSTFTTTSGAKSVTATPAVGDLILIFVQVSSDQTWSAPTDDNSSGTYTQLGGDYLSDASANFGRLYARDALIASASSTIFSLANPSADTGGGLAIIKVTGMSRAGASAVRQSKIGNFGSGGTTPATGTWTSNKLTTNPVIGCVLNLANPAARTPTTSYSELLDTGYASPDTGIEIQYINSGDTTNTMTWGNSSASAWSCMGVELDASQDNNMFLLF